MGGRLRDDIKQQRPFESGEQEAFLNVLRTADALMQGIAAVLKPFKLSHSQYNLLRILRGAGAEGLACREIAERMITRDPDITRLLDRFEGQGLGNPHARRKGPPAGRARITSGRLCVLAQLDEPIGEVGRRQLKHLGEQRLRTLISSLELAREKGG